MKHGIKRIMEGQGEILKDYIETELNARIGGLTKVNKKDLKDFEAIFLNLKATVSSDDELLKIIKQSVMDNESADAARDVEINNLKSINESLQLALKESLKSIEESTTFNDTDIDELLDVFDKSLHGNITTNKGSL